MADRPILFSAPMVRALLAGTKTQTRRAMNPQPELQGNGLYHVHNRTGGVVNVAEADVGAYAVDYLRIALGDRLYVRESCCGFERPEDGLDGIKYAADDAFIGIDNTPAAAMKWLDVFTYRAGEGLPVPSIHMPRWASRITLAVTDVRVERLQDITEADALAEGIVPVEHRPGGTVRYSGVGAKFGLSQHTARLAYAHLWDSINGEDAWAENPWVAAYTFTVQMGNIDQLEAA